LRPLISSSICISKKDREEKQSGKWKRREQKRNETWRKEKRQKVPQARRWRFEGNNNASLDAKPRDNASKARKKFWESRTRD
jgi:hypothetical protein